MRRQDMKGVLVVVALAIVGAGVPVQTEGQFAGVKRVFGGGKDPGFQSFTAPSQRFTVEYPKSDWQVQAGGTGSVTFTQKKSEASVAIEYDTLAVALEPAEITEEIAGYEIDVIKRQLPKAEGFTPKFHLDAGRRLIVIDYTRPAVNGGNEHARQYSLVAGKDVYRIICSAAPALFDKYEPVFAHVVSSFKVTGT